MARGTLLGIRRYTANGIPADEDSNVQKELDHLDALFLKRILPTNALVAELERAAFFAPLSMKAFLETPLTPRRTTGGWRRDSLADKLSSAGVAAEFITLEEWIDAEPQLAELKYEVLDELEAELATAQVNAKVVLDPARIGIVDYLLAVGFYVMGVRSANGMANFLLRNEKGVASVAGYTAVSAARAIVSERQLRVDGINDDDGDFASRVESVRPSLSVGSFVAAVEDVVESLVFEASELRLIEAGRAALGIEIRPEYLDRLVRSVRQAREAGVVITNANVASFLPLFLSQAAGDSTGDDDEPVDVGVSADQFEVDFFTTGERGAPVNVSAVKCAAQLFYAMVLGDELRVFDAVNTFTHEYLLKEDLPVENERLRRDLQLYVFSDKFEALDPVTKRMRALDRSRPDERQMFYRQVFASGRGEATEDMVVNDEFPRLWKVLMYESAQYLERARESLHPQTFVSAQPVQQAIEDVQYNLSVHCTGMANVMTPLLYDELNFVIKRILSHQDVMRHVAPTGGTWLRTVERLHTKKAGGRPRATVLNNKAEQGHLILKEIAAYRPATFTDETLLRILGHVEGLIISQSILQDSLRDSLKRGDRAEEERSASGIDAITAPGGIRSMTPGGSNGNGDGAPPQMPGTPGGMSGAGGSSDWDF